VRQEVGQLEKEKDDAIRIKRVITEEVGVPRNDRTPGSALYAVPFQLTTTPSALWTRLFLEAWELPLRFTSMHRPGIARILGDRIILDGTTIEEVERFHLETLKLAIAEANKFEKEERRKSKSRASAQEKKTEQHLKHVATVASRLNFGH